MSNDEVAPPPPTATDATQQVTATEGDHDHIQLSLDDTNNVAKHNNHLPPPHPLLQDTIKHEKAEETLTQQPAEVSSTQQQPLLESTTAVTATTPDNETKSPAAASYSPQILEDKKTLLLA